MFSRDKEVQWVDREEKEEVIDLTSDEDDVVVVDAAAKTGKAKLWRGEEFAVYRSEVV